MSTYLSTIFLLYSSWIQFLSFDYTLPLLLSNCLVVTIWAIFSFLYYSIFKKKYLLLFQQCFKWIPLLYRYCTDSDLTNTTQCCTSTCDFGQTLHVSALCIQIWIFNRICLNIYCITFFQKGYCVTHSKFYLSIINIFQKLKILII